MTESNPIPREVTVRRNEPEIQTPATTFSCVGITTVPMPGVAPYRDRALIFCGENCRIH